MALASHPIKIYARSDATTPSGTDEVLGLNSVDFSPSMTVLDVTDFKDTTAAKKKLIGLSDGTIGLSGDLEMADAPQILLRANCLSGADCYIQVQFNPGGSSGQKGYSVLCKAKNFKLGASVDGKNTFSLDLEFNGAPALV